MHVAARRALGPVSRTRACAPRRTQHFHSTANQRDATKPSPEESNATTGDAEIAKGKRGDSGVNTGQLEKATNGNEDGSGFLTSLFAKVRDKVNGVSGQGTASAEAPLGSGRNETQTTVQESAETDSGHNSTDAARGRKAESEYRGTGIVQKFENAPQSTKELRQAPDVRRSRNKGPGQRRPKSPEPLKLELPSWFWDENLRTYDAALTSAARELEGYLSTKDTLKEWASLIRSDISKAQTETFLVGPFSVTGDPITQKPTADTSDEHPSFHVLFERFMEIYAGAAASFTTAQFGSKPAFTVSKANILLHCPTRGSIPFLRAVVHSAGNETGADVLRIDSQDLAELVALNLPMFKTTSDIQKLTNLGFETYSPELKPQENQEREDDENEDEQAIFMPVTSLDDIPNIGKRLAESLSRLDRRSGGRRSEPVEDADMSLYHFFNGLISTLR